MSIYLRLEIERTDETLLALLLNDKGSAGVTGADGGVVNVGANDGLVNGLASPDGLAACDRDVLNWRPLQELGDLK